MKNCYRNVAQGPERCHHKPRAPVQHSPSASLEHERGWMSFESMSSASDRVWSYSSYKSDIYRTVRRTAPGTRDMPLRVAILTDEPGWHGRELQRAFLALGVQSAFASLADCRIDLESPQARVQVPGFGEREPDAIFVRSIEAGSFE